MCVTEIIFLNLYIYLYIHVFVNEISIKNFAFLMCWVMEIEQKKDRYIILACV